MPSQFPKLPTHSAMAQTPVTHSGRALGWAGQRPVQLPQRSSVITFVSQPLLGCPSQSPKPGRHSPLTHVPWRQVGTVFGKTHAAPHRPQCSALPRSASQPSSSRPLQSACWSSQLTSRQTPWSHAATPPGRSHERSAPLLSAMPSQSSSMPLHVSRHTNGHGASGIARQLPPPASSSSASTPASVPPPLPAIFPSSCLIRFGSYTLQAVTRTKHANRKKRMA